MRSKILIAFWVVIVIGVIYLRPFTTTKAEAPKDPDKKYAIDLSPKAITSLSVERDGKTIAYRMASDHWEQVATAGKPATRSALAERMVAMITAGEQTVDLVNPNPTPDELKGFGLSPAATRLALGTTDGKEVVLEIGSANPANLGLYAKNNLTPEVVLVGYLVGYYVDLALEDAAGPKRQTGRAAVSRAQTTIDDPSSRLVRNRRTVAVESRALAKLHGGEGSDSAASHRGEA